MPAVTVSNLLQLASMPSYHPAISDDGRYVAFKTGWTQGRGPSFFSGFLQALASNSLWLRLRE